MTTKCEYCDHEFTNVLLRRTCPKCGQSLKRPAESYASSSSSAMQSDDGFDATGFAIGMATGIPLSPSRGISVGSMIGAALHSNPAQSSPAPAPDPTPSYSPPEPSSSSHESSSSYDSGPSSSSSSYDSGSSSSSSGGSDF